MIVDWIASTAAGIFVIGVVCRWSATTAPTLSSFSFELPDPHIDRTCALLTDAIRMGIIIYFPLFGTVKVHSKLYVFG
jgi:hypothetical protein